MDSNIEGDQTLNQLLVEMDGFKQSHNIVVFAATNRKELLDEALTRTGRFDRSIDVNLPDLDERKDIYDLHLTPLKISNDEKNINLIREKIAKRMASLSPGFSGADIANVCNETAIRAVREGHNFCTNEDFEWAIEKVIGGIEREDKGDEE
jgi:ATP-dependent Zn protease